MRLTFASYNIHKAVGLDRRRDPHRILAVLREIDADVIALQEVDRRFGRRESVLPHGAIEQLTHYRPVPLAMRPDSLGWHGNALLVRRGIEVVEASIVPLPTLEPRGAVRADVHHRWPAPRPRRGHASRSVRPAPPPPGPQRARACGPMHGEAAPAVLMGDTQ